MEILLEKNTYPLFLIEIEKNLKYRMSFKVYEAVSWEIAEPVPIDVELYLHGTIKWDGCSHVWLGEDEENPNGYLHLCGKEAWDNHVKVMNAVYSLAATSIINYDKKVAE